MIGWAQFYRPMVYSLFVLGFLSFVVWAQKRERLACARNGRAWRVVIVPLPA